jgi:succinylglutamic semialdehyde dehydrogenase
LTEVDAMVAKVAISIDAYHDRCRTVSGEFMGSATYIRFRPHGVVAVFGPFNLPGHLPNGHIVPALLAGNTVVFKPSEQAPLVAQETMALWEAAGIAPGVLNVIQGGPETGAALSGDPDLDGLLFTGSAATGKALHRAFAGHPEKVLALEMGGNNPLVVHQVADLDAAARLTVLSAYITAGQRCSCARRLIVPVGHEGDNFVERLVLTIQKVRVGAYTDNPEPFMGPLISKKAAEHLLAAQEELAAAGGTSLVQMRRVGEIPTMLTPGLMDVTRVPERPDAELFGPFLQLIRIRDFEAALHEADNTAYGLSAGLLSDNKALYDEFFRSVRAGVITWNRQTTGASSRLPFGGVKASGNHRPSAYYAADYCSYPVASIETERLTAPAQMPPGLEE